MPRIGQGGGARQIKEEQMEVKKVKLAEITPYAKNAKKHDKRQINNVAESIR